MCILLDTDKDYELLHDRPVLSSERTPHDKQNRNCLDHNQRGSAPRRTDILTE